MKVSQHNPVQSQQIEKSQKSQASDKARETRALESHPASLKSGTTVDISPEAQLMKQASEIAKSAPDMRLEKVEQLKKSIQEGTYQIESSKIADRLVDDHFKNHFGKSHL